VIVAMINARLMAALVTIAEPSPECVEAPRSRSSFNQNRNIMSTAGHGHTAAFPSNPAKSLNL